MTRDQYSSSPPSKTKGPELISSGPFLVLHPILHPMRSGAHVFLLHPRWSRGGLALAGVSTLRTSLGSPPLSWRQLFGGDACPPVGAIRRSRTNGLGVCRSTVPVRPWLASSALPPVLRFLGAYPPLVFFFRARSTWRRLLRQRAWVFCMSVGYTSWCHFLI